MTATQELYSWFTPPKVQTRPAPEVGHDAPTTDRLQFPRDDRRPVVVTFLRHCGCPFAEKTFLRLRDAAAENPDIHFLAVSHSNAAHTAKWQQAVATSQHGRRRDDGQQAPPTNEPEVLVDDERGLFGAWGLGVASVWHVLHPRGLYALYRMARDEGIVNRPTESGSRWQTSGSWAVDGDGKVVWGGPARTADEIPEFADAVRALRG